MDTCVEKLIAQMTTDAENRRPSLLWMDENFDVFDIENALNLPSLQIITNRFDNVKTIQRAGGNIIFSDFVIENIERPFDRVYLRVSKERLVNHHCLNTSIKNLTPKGQIFLIGRKEDGIKTYYKQCIKTLGLRGELKKNKDIYYAQLTMLTEPSHTLNDGDYTQLRQITELDIANKHYPYCSKPGVYGWQKIDAGSRFLIDTLVVEQALVAPTAQTSALDLGCGSGYLSLALDAFGFQRITATDNSATAILACQHNFTMNNIQAQCLPGDGGNTLTNQYDVILCNPPFHKGFNTHKNLTEHFVRSGKRRLAPQGRAFFVTNAFIGIEALIKHHQLSYNMLANNGQYKVLEIRHGTNSLPP